MMAKSCQMKSVRKRLVKRGSGVAQRYAFFAFLCGSSPVQKISCFVINAVVHVSMLRTAEEAKRRLPLRYATR